MPALPPAQPGFELLVASHGMSQGLSQSDGIQLFPRIFVRSGKFRFGGQWRNVSSRTANGVGAVFARFSGRVERFDVDASISYRLRTGARSSQHPRAWEFSAGARRSFGRLGMRITSDFSPDEFGTGPSFWIDAGPSFDLTKSTRISANFGLRARGGVDYRAFNAGISHTVAKGLTLDARAFGTDQVELGHVYSRRVVLSARFAL